LQFVWISNNKIHSKNNFFHTLVLKIVKLTLLNFTHPRLSTIPKFQNSFQFWFYLFFIEKNDLIINNSHTICSNCLKPSWCTLTHQGLPQNTKSTSWRVMVWEISAWQIKQNKLLCFIYVDGGAKCQHRLTTLTQCSWSIQCWTLYPLMRTYQLWEHVINLYQLSTQVHNAHLIGRVRKN
jgi:hypothetical protein